jgi:hypothetical protein
MPHDDDLLVGADELASFLRVHEGPPQPARRRRRTSGAGAQPPRRRRRFPLRWTMGAAAAALLVGSGLGFGLGSSITPSGGAAETTAGLGFLPERGWFAVRSRFEATPERPSFAIASNVPLAPLDARLAGRLDWSGYPQRALQNLKPRGTVILASFALRGVHRPSDESFPRRGLPLRLRDAASVGRQRSQYYLRSYPVSRYEIRAAVGEHNVIVSVYFGTRSPSQASILAAQRQLDRLVVGSTRPTAQVDERALPLQPSAPSAAVAGTASRIVDRTFACNPIAFGGVGDLDVNVSPTREDVIHRKFVATLEVRTGESNSDTSLVLARARSQQFHPGLAIPRAVGGAAGVFASSRRCAPTRAAVPLSSKGLAGAPIRWEKWLDCAVRGPVLVHVRSVLQKPAAWRPVDRTYTGARQAIIETKLAVRLQRMGKPIAYGEFDAKGRTKLWYSSACS